MTIRVRFYGGAPSLEAIRISCSLELIPNFE
jgi:hypothetical protein